VHSLKSLSVLFKIMRLPAQLFIHLSPLGGVEVRDVLCELKSLDRKAWGELLREVHRQLQELQMFDILYPSHSEYPQSFYQLKQPPVFLCALGDLRLLAQQKITVIGTRRPSLSFIDWMNDQYFKFLRINDVVTVSGGAFGIDHLATQTALFCGRSSVVILPSGLSVSYPSHTRQWLKNPRVLSLSEYFPYETVRNYHFVNRNRLLGSLSPHVLVVQCATKSGTMTTVRIALDSGCEVLTVPSFPNLIESSGNIQLMKDGAQIIATAEDLSLALRLLAPNP